LTATHASRGVAETTYSPGEENFTAPGLFAVEVAGEPPGKIHE